MRKILLPLMLAASLTVGLTACGSPSDNALPNPDKSTFAKIDKAGDQLGKAAGKEVDKGVKYAQSPEGKAAAKKAAEKAKELGKAAEKALDKGVKYAESPEGKRAAKNIGKKAEDAAKKIGGVLGDYVKDASKD